MCLLLKIQEHKKAPASWEVSTRLVVSCQRHGETVLPQLETAYQCHDPAAEYVKGKKKKIHEVNADVYFLASGCVLMASQTYNWKNCPKQGQGRINYHLPSGADT